MKCDFRLGISLFENTLSDVLEQNDKAAHSSGISTLYGDALQTTNI